MTIQISVSDIHNSYLVRLLSRPEIIDFFEGYSIVLSSVENADIVLSDHFHELGIKENRIFRHMMKYGSHKQYLVWTEEPRFSIHFKSVVRYPFLPPLHVLNPYTGIFLKNEDTHFFAPSGSEAKKLPFLEEFDFQNRKIVALMRYRNNQREWSLKHNGKELDLCYLRTQIGLKGHALGVMDIYGQGWGDAIRKGVSRAGKFHGEKMEILSHYHFNLAFENTNFSYYCTEKIWDPICAHCLPIYYGEDNAIYDDFPRNSFLDYCEFESAEEMFAYIQAMTAAEFRERINLCIQAHNTVIDRVMAQKQVTGDVPPSFQRLVEKLHELMVPQPQGGKALGRSHKLAA